MAFYYSKRKLKVREEEEAGELNIVPYLDILMNLIIFMLLSINGLVAFGILNVNAPSYGGPSAGLSQDEADKPKLTLSVAISKQGHYVSSENATISKEGAPTIPLNAQGEHDYAALNQKMQEVKAAFPTETKVVIAADPDIPYEVLVQTMDALRETQSSPRRLLFPDVTLGSL